MTEVDNEPAAFPSGERFTLLPSVRERTVVLVGGDRDGLADSARDYGAGRVICVAADQCARLRDAVREAGGEQIDVLSLSCDGAEWLALRSLAQGDFAAIGELCGSYHLSKDVSAVGGGHKARSWLRTRLEASGFQVTLVEHATDPRQGWFYARHRGVAEAACEFWLAERACTELADLLCAQREAAADEVLAQLGDADLRCEDAHHADVLRQEVDNLGLSRRNLRKQLLDRQLRIEVLREELAALRRSRHHLLAKVQNRDDAIASTTVRALNPVDKAWRAAFAKNLAGATQTWSRKARKLRHRPLAFVTDAIQKRRR